MLTDILKLLGLDAETISSETRAQIQTIADITTTRLAILLGGVDEIPETLQYIVTEVAVIRYNRIGSEGVSSHNVDGESMTWSKEDFEPYQEEIQAWLNAQEDPSTTRGQVRFL